MSAFEPDGEKFITNANEQAQEFNKLESTLGDIFTVNVGMQIDELNSNSSYNGNRDINSEKKKIKTILGENGLGEQFINSYTKPVVGQGQNIDWDGLSRYVNDNLEPDEPIKPVSELISERDRVLDQRRDYYNRVMEGASGMKGFVGGMAGSITGMSVDPLQAAISVVSIPAVGIASTSRAMYTASAFARSAAFNAAAAIPVEPFIHDWKEEIGADNYGLKDSLINVFASGLLGGTVSGIGANIGYKYAGESFLSTDRPSLVQSFKDVGINAEDAEVLAQAQYEMNLNPDRNMDVEEHTKIIEERQESMNNRILPDKEPDIDMDNDETLTELFNKSYGVDSEDVNLNMGEGVVTPAQKLAEEFKTKSDDVLDLQIRMGACNAV